MHIYLLSLLTKKINLMMRSSLFYHVLFPLGLRPDNTLLPGQWLKRLPIWLWHCPWSYQVMETLFTLLDLCWGLPVDPRLTGSVIWNSDVLVHVNRNKLLYIRFAGDSICHHAHVKFLQWYGHIADIKLLFPKRKLLGNMRQLGVHVLSGIWSQSNIYRDRKSRYYVFGICQYGHQYIDHFLIFRQQNIIQYM